MGLLGEIDYHTPKDICQKCKAGDLITGRKYIYCDNEQCSFRYEINNNYGDKAPSHWTPSCKKLHSEGKIFIKFWNSPGGSSIKKNKGYAGS